MRVVIETDEQYRNLFLEIANSIKAKITFADEELYEELPDHVKKGVEESREEMKKGEVSSNDEVLNKYISKLK